MRRINAEAASDFYNLHLFPFQKNLRGGWFLHPNFTPIPGQFTNLNFALKADSLPLSASTVYHHTLHKGFAVPFNQKATALLISLHSVWLYP